MELYADTVHDQMGQSRLVSPPFSLNNRICLMLTFGATAGQTFRVSLRVHDQYQDVVNRDYQLISSWDQERMYVFMTIPKGDDMRLSITTDIVENSLRLYGIDITELADCAESEQGMQSIDLQEYK